MSKLSFRARALDASKPMPIYMAEELPDLPDYSAINRAVPQMPSGMEKEEECEHHLQRAICAGLIIPTPEVVAVEDAQAYDKIYPANYKQPRQLIHMQPFAMEQDIPDYDMDSEDERWLMSQAKKLDLNPLKFEEMMDRLEKSSGQTVVTINEAKALLKEDDDLIIAVFDYWLNKRLKMQHPLILSVKTEHRAGSATNNPYLAFRRRTEKMQTRKNRKNDETSYEKMLKLRRDLSRAVTLLELVKRREKTKREYVHLTVEVFEKRFQARDFSGAMVAEMAAIKTSRPAFTQLFQNHYTNPTWEKKAIIKDENVPRKEKRQYKKRKHKSVSAHHGRINAMAGGMDGIGSSDEDDLLPQASPEPEEAEEEGQFAFRRNKLCNYHMPITNTQGNWPWCSREENGLGDKRYRYTLTSLSNPRRCVGFARRRVGRGGRIILDRTNTDMDDLWKQLDFNILDSGDDNTCRTNPLNTILDSETLNISESVGCDVKTEIDTDETETTAVTAPTTDEWIQKMRHVEMVEFLKEVRRDWLHFRPKTPPPNAETICNLLPAEEDAVFLPNLSTPVTMKIESLETPSSVLDATSFLTTPFSLDDLYSNAIDWPTETNLSSDVGGDSDRTFGCSRFKVADLSVDNNNTKSVCSSTEKKQSSILSSTLTSPKLNSVNTTTVQQQQQHQQANHINNGPLLPHSELASTSSRRGNKMHQNAYTSVQAPSSPRPALSAHTLTLNSHSANILEIPSLSSDTDSTTKLNSTTCTESNNTSATTPTANNKNNKQAIVRKNNLVMEVT